jgi:hypothetical protein
MPWVGFETSILVFERAKTVHALNRAATVIGWAQPSNFKLKRRPCKPVTASLVITVMKTWPHFRMANICAIVKRNITWKLRQFLNYRFPISARCEIRRVTRWRRNWTHRDQYEPHGNGLWGWEWMECTKNHVEWRIFFNSRAKPFRTLPPLIHSFIYSFISGPLELSAESTLSSWPCDNCH